VSEITRSNWGRRGFIVCAATWLVLALGLGALVGGQNLRRYYLLATDGIKTQGVVVDTEPQNHQLVRYSYQVAGISQAGVSNIGYGNPPFASLHAGAPVLVYYDSSEPTSSVLGEPAPRLSNEVVSVALVMLLFPSLIVWRLVSKGVLPRS